MTLEVREFEIREVNAETREFSGIAVPFGEVIKVGDYKESFVRGAFADGSKATVFYAHDHRNNGTPIGKLIASKNIDGGFEVRAKISNTPKGDEVYALLKDGVLSKMSVGFEPVKHSIVDGVVTRTAAILREVSIVPMPAYAGANIAEVRDNSDQKEIDETMPEKIVLETDSVEVSEMRDALADLERKVAVLNAGGNKEKNTGPRFHNNGAEFLKDLAAGKEEALQEYRDLTDTNFETRAYTGSTTEESVARPEWVARGVELVRVNRKTFNLFNQRLLPASGNSIEYPLFNLADSTGAVAQQAAEGDDLTFFETEVSIASATVKTYGGYARISKQAIQRSTIPYLEIALENLSRSYGRATDAAVTAVLQANSGNVGTGFTLSTSTGPTWLNFALEGAGMIWDNGLSANAEFILVSRDVFNHIATIVDSVGRPLFVVSGEGAGENVVGHATTVEASGSIGGLPMVVDPLLAAKSAFVGSSEALEVYESGGAPYRLGIENPVALSQDFSLYGYMAIASPNPKALFKVTVA